MLILLKILVFVSFLLGGLAMIVYSVQLTRFFGKSWWAEQHFQFWGGTYFLWKLAGIVAILFGIIFALGWLDFLFT